MLKYATAIRVGTASTDAIPRRFMKANVRGLASGQQIGEFTEEVLEAGGG